MYRQEHRFSPDTPIFRRFDVWYIFRIPIPFPHPLEYLQSRHRNSRYQFVQLQREKPACYMQYHQP